MHKKHHEKFKILGILAVTTQAREGIETHDRSNASGAVPAVTTQAREGIETTIGACNYLATHVTTQAREGIETVEDILAEDWLFA